MRFPKDAPQAIPVEPRCPAAGEPRRNRLPFATLLPPEFEPGLPLEEALPIPEPSRIEPKNTPHPPGIRLAGIRFVLRPGLSALA